MGPLAGMVRPAHGPSGSRGVVSPASAPGRRHRFVFRRLFVDELLAGQEDAQRQTDGVLVHGENSAALRLLAEQYAGRVAMCTIDPPYNTGIGVWSFADRFAHDAWSRMMEDRLELAERLLSNEARYSWCSTITNRRGCDCCWSACLAKRISWRRLFGKRCTPGRIRPALFGVARLHTLLRPRQAALAAGNCCRAGDTHAYSNHDGDPRGPWKPDPVYANKPYSARYQIAKPNGVLLDPPPGRYWRYSERALLEKAARQEIVWGEGAAYRW